MLKPLELIQKVADVDLLLNKGFEMLNASRKIKLKIRWHSARLGKERVNTANRDELYRKMEEKS